MVIKQVRIWRTSRWFLLFILFNKHAGRVDAPRFFICLLHVCMQTINNMKNIKLGKFNQLLLRIPVFLLKIWLKIWGINWNSWDVWRWTFIGRSVSWFLFPSRIWRIVIADPEYNHGSVEIWILSYLDKNMTGVATPGWAAGTWGKKFRTSFKQWFVFRLKSRNQCRLTFNMIPFLKWTNVGILCGHCSDGCIILAQKPSN